MYWNRGRKQLEPLFVGFCLWVLFGILLGMFADKKGYSFFLWTIICLISGPFGLIGVLILPSRKRLLRTRNSKATMVNERVFRDQQRIAEQELELEALAPNPTPRSHSPTTTDKQVVTQRLRNGDSYTER